MLRLQQAILIYVLYSTAECEVNKPIATTWQRPDIFYSQRFKSKSHFVEDRTNATNPRVFFSFFSLFCDVIRVIVIVKHTVLVESF